LDFFATPPVRDAVSATAEAVTVRPLAKKALAQKAPVSKQKAGHVEEAVGASDARASITLEVPK